MSTMNLPQTPAQEKPEPPSIVAMLRRVQATIGERDRLAFENLRHLCRTLEGGGHV